MKTNVNPKLVMGLNSLRKENTFLKKTLTELSRQHAEHNNLIERFLTFVIERLDCQKEPCKQEVNPCCGMNMRRNRGGGTSPASVSEEQASSSSERRAELLEACSSDALEENKKWLEYDQQREACIRGMMTRMLWLEDQLDKASRARSQQHNEDYSDEDRASRPKTNFQRHVLMKHDTIEFAMRALPFIHDHLRNINDWFSGCGDGEENERKVLPEDVEQQDSLDDCLVDLVIKIFDYVRKLDNRLFNHEENSGNEDKELPQTKREDHHQSEDEEQQLSEDTKDLQRRLDEEEREYISQLQEDQQDPGEYEEDSRESLSSFSNSSNSLNESTQQCSRCQTVSSLLQELMDDPETCLD